MAQRQPTDAQIDAAKRILAHDHKRTYAQGAKGTTIRAIQIMLASKGYEPGRFDGDWGAQTQGAWDKMMSDRGWAYNRATPKALADVSKELGQPLPRQRPEPGGQFIGGNGVSTPDASAAPQVDVLPSPPAKTVGGQSFRDFSTNPGILPPDATSLPMVATGEAGGKWGEGASATMHMNPVAPPSPPPDNNGYGPALASLDQATRDSTGDFNAPQFGTSQFVSDLPPLPPTPPDPGLPTDPQMRSLVGLPPLPPPPQVSDAPNFDASRYDNEFGMQPQGDGSFIDNLSTAMFGVDPPQEPPGITTLRQALINRQGGPFPGRPDFPAPNQMNTLEALRRALLADRASKVAGY